MQMATVHTCNRIEDCNECDILATNQYQWIKSFFLCRQIFCTQRLLQKSEFSRKELLFSWLNLRFLADWKNNSHQKFNISQQCISDSAFHTIIQLVETRVQETKRKFHGIHSIKQLITRANGRYRSQAWRTFFIKSIEIMTASW